MRHSSRVFPYQRIAALVREDITSGRYQPGDRLPGTRTLAARYTIGQTTIRKALTLLCWEGMLIDVLTPGTFHYLVAEPAAWGASESMRLVQKVRKHMNRAGLAPRDAAALVGVTPSQFYRILSGTQRLTAARAQHIIDLFIAEE